MYNAFQFSCFSLTLYCQRREDFHWYYPSLPVSHFITQFLIHVLSLLETSSVLTGEYSDFLLLFSVLLQPLLAECSANTDYTNQVGGPSLYIIAYL